MCKEGQVMFNTIEETRQETSKVLEIAINIAKTNEDLVDLIRFM